MYYYRILVRALTSTATTFHANYYIPGIIELPGSFSGSESSPNPHLGPEAKNLKSLAIFIIEHARTLRAPDTYVYKEEMLKSYFVTVVSANRGSLE